MENLVVILLVVAAMAVGYYVYTNMSEGVTNTDRATQILNAINYVAKNRLGFDEFKSMIKDSNFPIGTYFDLRAKNLTGKLTTDYIVGKL